MKSLMEWHVLPSLYSKLCKTQYAVNKFYVATRKQIFFSTKQQVLHLMASVQYLKTSFICGAGFRGYFDPSWAKSENCLELNGGPLSL